MNWNQIIAITVLGIVALMLGCKPNATGIDEALREKVVGTYERKRGNDTIRYVFLDNGLGKYHDGEQSSQEGTSIAIPLKWSIVDNEVHIIWSSNYVEVGMINPVNSIIFIADIRNGKRTERLNGVVEIDVNGKKTKETQTTYKKIK